MKFPAMDLSDPEAGLSDEQKTRALALSAAQMLVVEEMPGPDLLIELAHYILHGEKVDTPPLRSVSIPPAGVVVGGRSDGRLGPVT